MSDIPGTPTQSNFTDGDNTSGIILFVIALPVLLLALLLLRFLSIMAIDLCIMCDVDAARKDVDIWLKWLRLKRREQQNVEGHQLHGSSTDQQRRIETDAESNTEMVQLSFAGLSKKSKEELLDSMLENVVVISNDDWLESFSRHDNGDADRDSKEDGRVTCSICLCDIEIGQTASSPLVCDHIFHRKCIASWLDKNSACPCCRREIIIRDKMAASV